MLEERRIDTIDGSFCARHKNGTEDAVCKARVFLLEVCDFSIAFASNVRIREIDQVRDNTGIAEFKFPSFSR